MKKYRLNSYLRNLTIFQKLVGFLLISTIIRLFLGSNLQLGNDEVYYWTYAKYPDWSHFDHPPMVGFFIQLFTLDLTFDSEIAIRLSTIILSSLSTVLMFLIGKELKNELTGFVAAILFNISIYGFIISGLFVLPDGPLVFFWLASLLFFIKFTKTSTLLHSNTHLILSFLCLGFALYSKYQTVYLGFGYFLYLLLYCKKQFRNPILYIATLLPIAFMAIILYWNYSNNFIGFSFHSNRVSFFDRGINVNSLTREVLGQIGYNNPYNMVLIFISIIAYRRTHFLSKISKNLLLFISIPLILTTTSIAFFRDTLPHWSGIAYISLLFIPASYISDRKKLTGLYIVFILIISLSVVALNVVNKGWFIPKQKVTTEAMNLGKNDPTLDMFGWKQIRTNVEKLVDENNSLTDLPIVSNKWFPAAHLEYYVAKPLKKEIYVLGNSNDIHKYYWVNKLKKPLKNRQNAIYITHSRNFKDPDVVLADYFTSSSLIKTFPVYRNNRVVEYSFIYILIGYKPNN